jgi:hypothetical protein
VNDEDGDNEDADRADEGREKRIVPASDRRKDREKEHSDARAEASE